jgi:homopolymeric O-antigen transport system permease protein
MGSDWLREIWRYREVFYLLAWRDTKLRYRQTVLGAMWAVIQPLFTMMLFTVIFGTFAKIPSDGIPYPMFYYAALLPWTYLSNTVTQAGLSLVSNARLITKVYFPRVALPIAPALSGLVDFAIGSLLLVGFLLYYRLSPTWKLLYLLPIAALLVLLACAVGMLVSALNVRYRDVKYAVPFLLQIWFFATPIIYPASMVPERFRVFLSLNPLTGIVSAFRASCFSAADIEWKSLATSAAIIFALLGVSVLYFSRAEATLSDIV